MTAAVIIVAVISLVVVLRLRRLQEMRAFNWLVVPTLLVAAAMPSYVAWKVLDPAPAVGSGLYTGKVSPVVDKATIDIPEGHALLVTATLGEESEDPASERTAYSLKVKGTGWEQSASGIIKRKGAGAGPGVSLGGEDITDANRRPSRLGEDLQDRYEFHGSGTATIEVTNWSGTAATTLDLEVIEAPPPALWLWCGLVLVSLMGIFVEAKYGADQFAGDAAFLAMWAIFLRDGVTPLDDWQEVAKALMPAVLLGMLAIGGLGYIAAKQAARKEEPEPEPAPEPEPEPEASEGRRRRRRRKSE